MFLRGMAWYMACYMAWYMTWPLKEKHFFLACQKTATAWELADARDRECDEDLGGGVGIGGVRNVAAGVVGHGGGGGDVHGHRLVGVCRVRVQHEVALHGDPHAVTEGPGALV